MNEAVVKVGVTMIFVGTVAFLFGTIAEDGAYDTMARAANDIYDRSLLVRAYEEMRTAAITQSIGFLIFMLGIGISFYGMAQEPTSLMAATVGPQYPERPWQQLPPQDSSQRYPPQRI